jgi:hypothetical protein
MQVTLDQLERKPMNAGSVALYLKVSFTVMITLF